ncbi:glycoside hydrolase family 76 protein [Phormidesmis sp. 146-12]
MNVTEICRQRTDAGMVALQGFYNGTTGLWNTTGWWNAANALETTIDYCTLTQSQTYRTNLANTFEKNRSKNFLNEFYDDEGWWALTWIKAFDLTGEPRYLNMAKTIFNDMKGGWDAICGGGIWWSKQRKYKNAIANELFLAIAARLHLRTPGDKGAGSYLDWAVREWNWFKNSGMINRDNLINDGLTSNCQNNGQTTWTYNQGVILGGLVDLYRITNDRALLTQAGAIADAAIRALAPNGILREPCEPDCGADGPQFKGIFVRNLLALYQVTNKPAYKTFITRNADSIWAQCRNDANQFGLSWAGQFDRSDAARHSAAMDALNAALALNFESTTPDTYQAERGILHQLLTEAIYPGYHGGGYVAGWNRDGQWIDFKVTVRSSGRYALTFRYAAAGGESSRYLFVNGKGIVANLIFPGTGNWSRWSQVTVPPVLLNAGENTVSLIFDRSKGSRNWLNLNELIVQNG